MKQINKIKVERFYNLDEKVAEVNEVLKAIEEADAEMHFIDTLTGMPYGHKDYFKKHFNRMKDFRLYTHSSRSIMTAEMNGWIDLINHEIRLFLEDDVEVEYLVGKKAGQREMLKKSIAKTFIECEFCKEVK